jgi:hypothetical protein
MVWPLAMTIGCARAPQPSEARARNVVLITIDTLRADHVGAYGHARARTPALDALAAGGAVFDRAYAASPWPALATLMTGRYPSRPRLARQQPACRGGRADAYHRSRRAASRRRRLSRPSARPSIRLSAVSASGDRITRARQPRRERAPGIASRRRSDCVADQAQDQDQGPVLPVGPPLRAARAMRRRPDARRWIATTRDRDRRPRDQPLGGRARRGAAGPR